MANMQFSGTPNENERMQTYFNSLPTYIQETMKQSGVDMHTEAQLRQCAAAMMASHTMQS